jgi:phosphoglucomutase
MLVDVALLEREYFERRPDTADPIQLVSFGTSGHRGSSLDGFTEARILAITQAICDYRRSHGVDGPLCMGRIVDNALLQCSLLAQRKTEYDRANSTDKSSTLPA